MRAIFGLTIAVFVTGAATASELHRAPAHTPPFASSQAASLVVDPSRTGPAVSSLVRGANMAVWYDITQSGLAASFKKAAFTATRWPGGSDSDLYHWKTNSLCAGGYANANSTFDNFMEDVARPAHLDIAITLDYGSNAACSAGGDPHEAAAWVDYANNTKKYGVKYWTVGNEVYGSWEYDLHKKPNDAATYAAAVANGYYPLIKAKDPSAQVGVVVEPNWNPPWDSIVLKKAKYDFVEFHYYAQAPGQESDSYLLDSAPAALASAIAQVQSDLASAGRPNTPIYVGELGSVYANPGKQSTSITQSLFAGMALAQLMEAGVFRATWWLGYGGCSDSSSGNFSSSLYGWQNFGGYMIFSDGIPEYGCPNATPVARGVPLPTVRAIELLSQVAVDGEHTVAATLGTSSSGGPGSLLRAYAVTNGGGYALVLFNLNQTQPATLGVTIDGVSSGSSVDVRTYGKAQYDKSENNIWAGPVHSTLGAWSGTFSVKLPPWSMNVVTVSR